MKPGTYRVPDVLAQGAQIIGEVKNVTSWASVVNGRDAAAFIGRIGSVRR